MHRFFSITFSLLAIIGHVSVTSAESPFSYSLAYASELTVSNGMKWGSWGSKDMCPSGKFAAGFSLRVERPIGAGDDTALNGIRLHCIDPSKGPSEYITIESSVGGWGEWTDIKWCASGVLKSFRLKVESSQGDGDDTAANNIRFTCTDGNVLEGDGTDWGDWGFWSPKCLGKGICGIQTLVEDSQGSGDDTTLNDARMFCCSPVWEDDGKKTKWMVSDSSEDS